MRDFCTTLCKPENEKELVSRKKHIEYIIKWYLDTHQRFSSVMQTEAIHTLLDEQNENTSIDDPESDLQTK